MKQVLMSKMQNAVSTILKRIKEGGFSNVDQKTIFLVGVLPEVLLPE